MAFAFSIKEFGRSFKREMAASILPVAKAATLAMRDAAKDVQEKGRSNIAAAGFPSRWRTGFRAAAYPRGRKYAVDAVAYTKHKIGFATVFEEGRNIRGKPLLWVPVPGAPKKIGGKRNNPRLFARTIGPLQYVDTGRRPLLFAKISRGRNSTFNRVGGKLSLARLKKGGSQSVPVFVGLDAVEIRRRFGISEIVDRTIVRLPALYDKYLNPD